MPVLCFEIKVYGVVQGVGFRPFVRNLAVKFGLCGSVCNKGPYVDILAQGGEHKLAAFLQLLEANAPVRAEIRKIESVSIECGIYSDFIILKSENSGGEVFPSPDIAICEDCRRELFDKNDRRYLHPFINCTACGPRLTILGDMPYDRAKTSMADFEMCNDCTQEYLNPVNRRFHAQPVCCTNCGPKLKVIYPQGTFDDPVIAVRKVLREGGIAAVKGIGGFHLCCDASQSAAVSRLRKLKGRAAKPFAVMVKDMETARRECEVDYEAEKWLDSPQKPILLLKKRIGGFVCEETAPALSELGLMLPYVPLQLLLFDYPDDAEFTDCLIMTSGNISGAPICKDDNGALTQLSGICDIILSNNREIETRADDSVMSLYLQKPYMLRRSRGFAPLPVTFVKKGERSVFAVGGELKNTFCLTSRDKLYLSAFVGDLTDMRSIAALDEARRHLSKLLRIAPEIAVCDLHPGYNSTAYAKSLGLPVLEVQHHFAHIASCMAENKLDGEVIGVAFDGAGYGLDAAVWGGEFLKVSYSGFERLLSIRPFVLAGGDAAARQGFRPAVGLLLASCGAEVAREMALSLGICSDSQFSAQAGLIKSGVNCTASTSVGRLFDAASAILGLKLISTYEGEAAAALETAAEDFNDKNGIYGELPDLDTNDIIRFIAQRRLAGDSAASLAYYFHAALAKVVADGCIKCRESTGLNRVALSGGVFANRLLLQMCREALATAGFEVFCHHLVPCNDGGIALGQAAIGVFKNN